MPRGLHIISIVYVISVQLNLFNISDLIAWNLTNQNEILSEIEMTIILFNHLMAVDHAVTMTRVNGRRIFSIQCTGATKDTDDNVGVGGGGGGLWLGLGVGMVVRVGGGVGVWVGVWGGAGWGKRQCRHIPCLANSSQCSALPISCRHFSPINK